MQVTLTWVSGEKPFDLRFGPCLSYITPFFSLPLFLELAHRFELLQFADLFELH